MSRQEDTLTLHPPEPLVEDGLRWLQTIADRDDWPQKLHFQLMLCLEEALANLTSHAFPADAKSGVPAAVPEIELHCRRVGPAIHLEVIDNGVAFDPTAATLSPVALTLDDTLPGGHGLRLMRSSLSDMTYRREGDRNRLTLISHEAWPNAN